MDTFKKDCFESLHWHEFSGHGGSPGGGHGGPPEGGNSIDPIEPGEKIPPFSFLLGFDTNNVLEKSHNLNHKQCKDGEWSDPKGECQKIFCTEGKLLQDGICTTPLQQIRGLDYRMNFLLVLKNESNNISLRCDLSYQKISENIAEEIFNQVLHKIFSEVKVIGSIINIIFEEEKGKEKCDAMDSVNEQLKVYVSLRILANEEYQRDFFENLVLSRIINESISVQTAFSNKSFFEPLIIPISTLNIFDCIRVSNQNCFEFIRSYNAPKLNEFYILESARIQMNSFLKCPHVKINKDQITITIKSLTPPDIIVKVNFNEHFIEFTSYQDINQIHLAKDGKFYLICLDLITQKANSLISKLISMEEVPNKQSNYIQYVMTLSFMSLSLFCLTLTVVTYFLFSSLRSVTGCNTLGLSVSLILAQSMLLFTSHVKGPSVGCVVVGIINHFVWLVMFMWSFLCCLKMLQIFMSDVRPTTNNRAERREIVRNVILSLMIPAGIVVVVIIASYISSDRNTIGYGDRICSVDNVYALLVPLTVTIITNITFFILVVIKIVRMRKLSSQARQNKSDRKDLVAYVNLSTLTGMFWLLVVLGEVFDNEVIRYLAIFTNGFQGVFIFLAFMVNQHIKKLYADRFPCLSSMASCTTTSQSETSIPKSSQPGTSTSKTSQP